MADEEPSRRAMTPRPPDLSDVAEGPDSFAEGYALRTGRDLQSEKTKQDLDRLWRSGAVEGHLHRVVVWGLYTVAISAGLLFAALVYHYLSPYPFLAPQQLTDIKQLLFSGSLGAGISGVAKKYLGGGDTPKQ